MTRIGFAGLGIMGSRMAANFVARGLPTTVWNRTASACEALKKRGAGVAACPKELAAASDVVFTSLADPAAVRAVFFGEVGILAGLRAGARCVDTSTVSPALSRELAEACRARGADFLESPVTGSKLGAEEGTLLLMTGGRPALAHELEPLLMCIGKKAVYVGEVGAASTMKLVGNTIISFMLEGIAEGLTLARKAGIEPEKVLEMVQASGFASPYWTFKGGAMARREFETHFSIDLLHKDQALALAEADSRRVPMPGLAALHQVCSSARAMGIGGEDIAAVVKAVEAMGGAKGA